MSEMGRYEYRFDYVTEGEIMMRKVVLLATLVVLLTACGGSKPGVKITSVEYVDEIHSGGSSFLFEGKDIIQIKMDFAFEEKLVSDLDPASEDYSAKIYSLLYKGAQFYYQDEEVEAVHGYWPSKTGKNYAKEMTLFYLVPTGHSVQGLRFVYDGSVLGEGVSGLDTNIKPTR